MADPIRPVHELDVLLWPNGHWEYRNNVDPVWLQVEPTQDYEVIAYGTARWSSIVEEAS